ncbi:MAG: type II toxin-antitoxin system VapC family toxin [Opitutales bacterium]
MKVFWDSNLFIYLWEGTPVRRRQIDALRAFHDKQGQWVTTSTLTVAEVLVGPLKRGSRDTARRYLETLNKLAPLPFGIQAASRFARLRAVNPALKPPDAVQLASALAGGCTGFITNDRRLADLRDTGSLRIDTPDGWLKTGTR